MEKEMIENYAVENSVNIVIGLKQKYNISKMK